MALNSTQVKPEKFDINNQASSAVDKLFGTRKGEQVISGLKLISHEHIEVRPQPRTSFSSVDVTELANSINELKERGEGIEGTGILQPLLVTLLKNSDGSRYRLIAGERRFRASQEAGLPHVPCLLLTISENGILPVQLIENLQRQNLSPLDEGRALEQIQHAQDLSVRNIAKAIGKTRGYVTNRLDLLKMSPDVQQMVSSREDTLKHAALINKVEDQHLRAELIRAVIEDEISVKLLEQQIASNILTSTSSTQQEEKEPTTATPPKNKPINTPLLDSNTNTTQNPILTGLQPAAAFIAEAARQIKELLLTPDYKRDLRTAIQNIREELDKIERVAND